MAKATPRTKAEDAASDAPAPSVSSPVVNAPSGNVYTLRRLAPVQRMKLFAAIGPELSGNGPYLGYAAIACCVASINGESIAFPTTRRDLEAVVSRISEDDFTAIGAQVAVLNGFSPDPEVEVAVAKN
jgi:hypothetical protein